MCISQVLRIASGAILMVSSVATAVQAAPDTSLLTLDRRYDPDGFDKQALGRIHWRADGSGYTTIERSRNGGRDIVLHDPVTGAQRRPHRAQVDHPGLPVLRHDPSLDPRPRPLADQDRLDALVRFINLPGDIGPQGVPEARVVRDRLWDTRGWSAPRWHPCALAPCRLQDGGCRGRLRAISGHLA